MISWYCSRLVFASCNNPNDPLRDADELISRPVQVVNERVIAYALVDAVLEMSRR
jgi:hypothetical protein